MADIRVEGGDQLINLAKALKEAGRKDLKSELTKAISETTKPIVTDIRASVMSIPSKGRGRGTRAAIARAVKKQQKATANIGGVSIVVASSLDRGRRAVAFAWENKGEVHHPVFGGPGRAITRGRRDWFRGSAGKHGPQARAKLEAAMAEIAKKLERSL